MTVHSLIENAQLHLAALRRRIETIQQTTKPYAVIVHQQTVRVLRAVYKACMRAIAWLRPRLVAVRDRSYEAIRLQPGYSMLALLVTGLGFGVVGHGLVRDAEFSRMRAEVKTQQSGLEITRREAQREVNALAARLGELQAEANRLNALGERLTRIAQLGDGEFDFEKPVGIGGAGPVSDMPATELRNGLTTLDAQLKSSGRQLSVLEALLFNRELDKNATPSRAPVSNSYITSSFGGRADPFGGGHQFHKGIDFDAVTGDAVLSVADGVVTYSGERSGYGYVIEVDHGNGYVTRYAHNSILLGQVGDLVRRGQEIAKAGSTGRSTGTHVHFEVWENGVAVNPRQFLGITEAGSDNAKPAAKKG